MLIAIRYSNSYAQNDAAELLVPYSSTAIRLIFDIWAFELSIYLWADLFPCQNDIHREAARRFQRQVHYSLVLKMNSEDPNEDDDLTNAKEGIGVLEYAYVSQDG